MTDRSASEYTLVVCTINRCAYDMWKMLTSMVDKLNGLRNSWYKTVGPEENGVGMWYSEDDPHDYVYAGKVYVVETTDDEFYLFMDLQHFTNRSRSDIVKRLHSGDRIYHSKDFHRYLSEYESTIRNYNERG